MKKGIVLVLLLGMASFVFGQVTTEEWLILNSDPGAPSYMSAQDLRGVDFDAASFWNDHINTVSESWLIKATDTDAAAWQATGQARGVDVNTSSTHTGNTVLYADNNGNIVHVHDAATGAFLWDLDTTGVGSVFTGHTVSPYRIAVSQDGQVFVNSFDGIVVKWADDASTTPAEIAIDLSGEAGNSRAIDVVGSGNSVRVFLGKGTDIRVFDDDGSGTYVEATNRAIATGWPTECEAIAAADSNMLYAGESASGQDQTPYRKVYELTASGYVNNETLVSNLPYTSWFNLNGGIDVGNGYYVLTEAAGSADGFAVGTVDGLNYGPISGDTDGDFVYDAGMDNPTLTSDIALDAESGMVYWTAPGTNDVSGIGALRINTYGGNTVALADDDNNAVHIHRADNGRYLYDLSDEGLGALWTETAVAPYRVAVTSDGQIFANTFDGKVVRWMSDADTTMPEVVIDLSGDDGSSRALEAVGNGNGVTVYLSKGADIRAFQDDGTGTFVERADMLISAPFADEAEGIAAVDTNTVWLANALGDPNRAVYDWDGSTYTLNSAATSTLPFGGFVAQGLDVDPTESLYSLAESGGSLDGIAVGLFDGTNLPPDPSSLDSDGDGVYDASGNINGANLVTDVAIDSATNNVFWTSAGSGGGIGMLKAYPPEPTAQVTLAAQIGGDSQYRSFWVNGSWDADGAYDGTWSGPMVELTDPDGDNIFTGTVTLQVDDTQDYSFWVGSENDVNSFLEDGTAFSVASSQPVMPDTVVVDPSDTGFNEWVISLAGDFNSWDNAADNLTRNGQLWSTTLTLDASTTYEYKYTVMHSWSAPYGDGGVGSGTGNYSFTPTEAGDYTFTFNDADNSVSVGNPVLFASTDSIGFGETAINSRATIDFHLRNDGDAALYVTNVSFADSNYFTTSLGDTSIAPDSTLYANIYFSPTMEGSFRDTLFIETNAGNHQIILTGTGYNLWPDDWRILAEETDWFGTGHLVRSVAFSPATNHLYVLSRVGGTFLKVFDANTGDFLYDMDTEGVSGGTYHANMVAATKDGQIFVGNLALDGQNFKLYHWKNDFDHPTNVFDATLTGRAGDALSVAGYGDHLEVMVSGSGNEYVNVISTEDGMNFTNDMDIPLPEASAARYAISRIDTTDYGFINGPGVPVRYINGNGDVLFEFPGEVVSGSSVTYFEVHTNADAIRRFIAVFSGPGNYYPGTKVIELLGAPGDGLCSSYDVIPANTPTYAENDNTNGTGQVVYDPYTNDLVELVTNNGMTAYDFNLIEPDAATTPDFLPIAKARIDADSNFELDRLGETVTIYGYINSVNYGSTTNYYMEDGMAGINLYSGSVLFELNPGDVVKVTGELDQYNGLGEIVPASAEDVTVLSSGMVPDTTLLTIPEVGEQYEGMLVQLNGVTIVNPGDWPADGSNGSVEVALGTDTISVFIDKETDLDGWTPPSSTINLTGVIDQYTYSDPPDDGYEIRPRMQSDFQIVTGVNDGIASLPKEFKVYQNYPNPFNPTTNIKFDLPKQADVRIIVYNMLGQKVRTLVNQHMAAGYHEITWNSTNDFGQQVSTGLYIYRVIAGDKVTVKKMLLVK